MTEAKKQLVRRFFEEVWNQRNVDAIDELYADDFTLHAMWQNPAAGGSGEKSGKEMAKSIISNWFVIEDLHLTIEDMFAEGDLVVSRHESSGSHDADVMGIPATGKPVILEGITITKVQGDKVMTLWHATGAHTGGPLFGLPVTGKTVDVAGITINRIEDGKIAEVWDSWDRMGMLQQLGIIPATPPPGS